MISPLARDAITASVMLIAFVVIRALISIARTNEQIEKRDRINTLVLLFVGVGVLFGVIVTLVILYA